MASHTVTLIPGDGIGPETTAAMRRVVEASGADIAWEVAEAGAHLMAEHGTPLPASTVEAVKRNKVAIKGPVTTPVGTGFRSVNVALRKALDLYVCLRPVLSIPGAGGRYDDVDLVIVRENSEDLYAGVEFEAGSAAARKLIALCEEEGAGTIRPDSGISIKPISTAASERIVRYAFDYAEKHGRAQVTAVHKANIMKHTDGLFLRAARDVAAAREGGIAFDALESSPEAQTRWEASRYPHTMVDHDSHVRQSGSRSRNRVVRRGERAGAFGGHAVPLQAGRYDGEPF